MKSFFNVAMVVVVVMFMSSCGMMAVAGENVIVDETEDESKNEVVDDEKVIVDNEVTDEISDEVMIDEESDSEVADDVTDEEVSDEETTDDEEIVDDVVEESLPVANIFKSHNGELASGSEVLIMFYINETFARDLCVKYQITGGTIGIDYGLEVSSICDSGVKIVAGTTATELKITNLNKTSASKTLVVKVLEGSGYEAGTTSEVTIKLLEKEGPSVVGLFCWSTAHDSNIGTPHHFGTKFTIGVGEEFMCSAILDSITSKEMTISICVETEGKYTASNALTKHVFAAGSKSSEKVYIEFEEPGKLSMKICDSPVPTGKISQYMGGGIYSSTGAEVEISVEGEISDEETDSEVTDNETTDVEITDNEVSDDEISDEASDDETVDEEVSDEDISLPEIIVATEPGKSLHCKPFQTLVAPGNSVDLWDAGGTKSPTITNSTSTSIWYSHTGWCAATSDSLMDARGEGWEKFGVYRTGHNGDD